MSGVHVEDLEGAYTAVAKRLGALLPTVRPDFADAVYPTSRRVIDGLSLLANIATTPQRFGLAVLGEGMDTVDEDGTLVRRLRYLIPVAQWYAGTNTGEWKFFDRVEALANFFMPRSEIVAEVGSNSFVFTVEGTEEASPMIIDNASNQERTGYTYMTRVTLRIELCEEGEYGE